MSEGFEDDRLDGHGRVTAGSCSQPYSSLRPRPRLLPYALCKVNPLGSPVEQQSPALGSKRCVVWIVDCCAFSPHYLGYSGLGSMIIIMTIIMIIIRLDSDRSHPARTIHHPSLLLLESESPSTYKHLQPPNHHNLNAR